MITTRSTLTTAKLIALILFSVIFGIAIASGQEVPRFHLFKSYEGVGRGKVLLIKDSGSKTRGGYCYAVYETTSYFSGGVSISAVNLGIVECQ